MIFSSAARKGGPCVPYEDFPLSCTPARCHAKSVPGSNSTENADNANEAEKWTLATGTALCTRVFALYTKSREDGVQRGKSWKIGENAENTRIA